MYRSGVGTDAAGEVFVGDRVVPELNLDRVLPSEHGIYDALLTRPGSGASRTP
jgi:hypothetical protein